MGSMLPYIAAPWILWVRFYECHRAPSRTSRVATTHRWADPADLGRPRWSWAFGAPEGAYSVRAPEFRKGCLKDNSWT